MKYFPQGAALEVRFPDLNSHFGRLQDPRLEQWYLPSAWFAATLLAADLILGLLLDAGISRRLINDPMSSWIAVLVHGFLFAAFAFYQIAARHQVIRWSSNRNRPERIRWFRPTLGILAGLFVYIALGRLLDIIGVPGAVNSPPNELSRFVDGLLAAAFLVAAVLLSITAHPIDLIVNDLPIDATFSVLSRSRLRLPPIRVILGPTEREKYWVMRKLNSTQYEVVAADSWQEITEYDYLLVRPATLLRTLGSHTFRSVRDLFIVEAAVGIDHRSMPKDTPISAAAVDVLNTYLWNRDNLQSWVNSFVASSINKSIADTQAFAYDDAKSYFDDLNQLENSANMQRLRQLTAGIAAHTQIAEQQLSDRAIAELEAAMESLETLRKDLESMYSQWRAVRALRQALLDPAWVQTRLQTDLVDYLISKLPSQLPADTDPLRVKQDIALLVGYTGVTATVDRVQFDGGAARDIENLRVASERAIAQRLAEASQRADALTGNATAWRFEVLRRNQQLLADMILRFGPTRVKAWLSSPDETSVMKEVQLAMQSLKDSATQYLTDT